MALLEITILGSGTSQGIPVVGCTCDVCQSNDTNDKRLRTAALLQHNGTTVAIDAGPDFRQQMLREKVGRLDGILVTHNHKDHTAGIDDVRAFNWIQQKPMNIFARRSVLTAIREEYFYAFEENPYPGVPDINLNELDGSSFRINDMELTPIEAMHHRMPVYGYRTGNFSYLTDANFIETGELNKMKGSRFVVINALRREKHISHFTLEEAVDILQYLRPEKGFITHISHQMGKHSDLEKELPDGIFPAFDGMKLQC